MRSAILSFLVGLLTFAACGNPPKTSVDVDVGSKPRESTAPRVEVSTHEADAAIVDVVEAGDSMIRTAIELHHCADICRKLEQCRLYYFTNRSLSECPIACENDAREHFEDGVTPDQIRCMLEAKRPCGRLAQCGNVQNKPIILD